MLEMRLLHRKSIPLEQKTLLVDYPRADWEGHPNFTNFSDFWLQRHAMFRELGMRLIHLTQLMLDRDIDEREYQHQLFKFSEFLFRQLHTHHIMEDTHFFPEIGRNDTKVKIAIELLESDHIEITKLINNYTDSLKLCSTPRVTYSKADSLLSLQNMFNKALKQHMDDEEEINVGTASMVVTQWHSL